MMRKLIARLKKDAGDAVLTTVVIAMPAIMIAVGFAADTSKSAYVSSSYTSMAQRSAQTAVSAINSRGSLDNNSVRKFISEFRTQSGGSAFHTNETLQAETSTVCSTREINGVTKKLPYVEVTLKTARGSSTGTTKWTIENGQSVVDQPLGSAKYKVISADVYTGSPNFILGMFGTPCQFLKTSVNAISFGSNEDLAGPPILQTEELRIP